MKKTASRIVSEARHLVAFSGAGLSAESGVPTFRDATTGGLWKRHDPTRLASPQGFARDPQLVVEWYAHRRRAIAQAVPNPAHRALAARDDILNITQNVDDLLERAGAQALVRLHGTLAADRCDSACGYRESIDLADPPSLRSCPRCGDHLRPDVVWFGETLPAKAWKAAESACRRCDVLLIIGTSAAVHPAAGLIGLAKASGAQLIVINTQPSEASELADIELLGNASALVPGVLD